MTRATIVGLVAAFFLLATGAVFIYLGLNPPLADPSGRLSGDDWRIESGEKYVDQIILGGMIFMAGVYASIFAISRWRSGEHFP
jgi:hypothetical protein